MFVGFSKDPDSADGSEPRHLCNLYPGAFVGGRNDPQVPAGSFLLTLLLVRCKARVSFAIPRDDPGERWKDQPRLVRSIG